MKYIIVKDDMGEEHAIIFPKQVIHKHVGRIHRATDTRLISAGFCEFDTDSKTWHVWGKSESLRGMESRPEDAIILGRSFGDWVHTR